MLPAPVSVSVPVDKLLRVRLPPEPVIAPAKAVLLVSLIVSAPVRVTVGVPEPVAPKPVLLASGPMVWLLPFMLKNEPPPAPEDDEPMVSGVPLGRAPLTPNCKVPAPM